ncbi:MAG: HAD-IA family hydrolase, partial [Candidatus Acidiferrum sp.]
PFTREEFRKFMLAESKEFPESRAVLRSVAHSGKYFVGAINNEPLELNQYRIETFRLREDFQVFFSSCYVHARKPEELIFRVALAVTQRPADECLFIDDRPLNLESPRRLGMHAIHFQNAEQLRAEMKTHGVEV